MRKMIACLVLLSACAAPRVETNAAGPSVAVARSYGAASVPVYQYSGDTTGYSQRRLIGAYSNVNRAGISGAVSGVAPFAVSDMTGGIYRVDGQSASIAFISNVRVPYFSGTELSPQDLSRAVSIRAAEMTGCAWTGSTATRTDRYRTPKSYFVFLNC